MVFKQNDISFLTSERDTSWGVVTTIAPSYGDDFKYYTIEICSSDVPGGVSIIKKSRSPHATSVKNCRMRPFFLGPLHIIASSYWSIKNPIDITPRFSLTYIGYQPSLLEWTSLPSNPIILGIDGPHISTSNNPTSNPFSAKIWAN